jgi:DNA-binding MarR family transcriptional regulator
MDRNPLALENQVSFAAVTAARSIVGLYRPVLAPLGLTHPQYLVMLALWDGHNESLSSLSDIVQMEPATLTPLVKRLEASGLVHRARKVEDERILLILLTERGLALRDRAHGVPAQVAEKAGMSLAELSKLRDTLQQVARRISRIAARDAASAAEKTVL